MENQFKCKHRKRKVICEIPPNEATCPFNNQTEATKELECPNFKIKHDQHDLLSFLNNK